MHATEELQILIRTIVDQSGLQRTQQSLRGVQQETQTAGRSGASSLLAFGAAAGVAGIAVGKLGDFVGDSIDAAREHERVSRATAAAFGQQATQWTRFAAQLSASTGFTSDAIQQAALYSRTLSKNFGLQTEQQKELIRVSADLAAVYGYDLQDSLKRVSDATRGEAEASESLGLTLGDVYMKSVANNGAFKDTWETMSETAKAQARFNEILKQTAEFSGAASASTDSLDASFRKAGTSAHDLQVEIGELIKPGVVTGLNAVADALDLIRRGHNVGQEGVRERVGGGGTGGFIEAPAFDTAAAAKRIKDAAEAAVRPGVTVISNALADIKDGVKEAAAAARVAFLDQIGAAVRDLAAAQERQNALQREGVQLSAEEARIKLSLLPAQQRMAELQRQTTEAQVRARLAALPATEHLEDLQFELQRAQLIVQQRRGIPLEDRRAAMRRIIELGRGEMAAAELEALDASRGVTLAGRAGERVSLQGQLMDVGVQRQLADVTAALTTNQLQSQISEAVVQAQQSLVQDIIDANRAQPHQVNINITMPDGTVVSYAELLEANAQSQGPATIQQSGVRRS